MLNCIDVVLLLVSLITSSILLILKGGMKEKVIFTSLLA